MWKKLKEMVRRGLPVWSDSREVKGEGVFVVFGENYRFLEEAIKRGASHVVVDRKTVSFLPSFLKKSTVVVEDAPRALGELARAYYGTEDKDFILIGITGTNGKTTVSYLLEHLFNSLGRKVGIIGTVNYRWGDKSIASTLTTPGCLRLHSIVSKMLEDGVEVVVMEVSSHGLVQHRVAGFMFDVAIFTNLSHDHLDYHRDMEDYFNAKKRLFKDYLKKDAVSVINVEDKYGMRLVENKIGEGKVIGFGFKDIEIPEMVRGEISYMGRKGMGVRSIFKNKKWDIHLPLIGKHNALNLLSVEGAALGLEMEPINFKVLENIDQIPGRLEQIENPLNYNIVVDYAHTPDALEKVLSSLKEMDFHRLIVVFGCGGDRDRTKRPIMGQVVCKYADIAVLTSDNPRFEDPEEIMEEVYKGMNSIEIVREVDRRRAIAKAISLMNKEDVLLIAGKGHEDYQEIRGKRYPFSDREVVKEYFSR